MVADIQRLQASTLQPSRLLGDHQKINAALALATVEVLQQANSRRRRKNPRGPGDVNWPGRLQLIETPAAKKSCSMARTMSPGAEALRAALEKHFAGRPGRLLIFGALADKNWPDICRILAPLAAKIFTVPVASERTADARRTGGSLSRRQSGGGSRWRLNNLAAALNACKDEPFIVITGSLYLVGEALERLGLSPADDGRTRLERVDGAAKIQQ